MRDTHLDLHFDDDGVPFDPREAVPVRADPPPDSDDGGRGLVLVRSVAERPEYLRTPQHHNLLTVTIAL